MTGDYVPSPVITDLKVPYKVDFSTQAITLNRRTLAFGEYI